MKSFEPVYKELEELFIQQLPEYIQKINIEHNDGIILKPFQNTKLDADSSFPYKILEINKNKIIINVCIG